MPGDREDNPGRPSSSPTLRSIPDPSFPGKRPRHHLAWRGYRSQSRVAGLGRFRYPDPVLNCDYIDRLFETFHAILAREPWDHDHRDLGSFFEVAARRLFRATPGLESHLADGAIEIRAQRKGDHKVVFEGRIIFLTDAGDRQEPFRAAVVDKRITKQGIWLTMEIGKNLQHRAEGDVIDLMKSRED